MTNGPAFHDCYGVYDLQGYTDARKSGRRDRGRGPKAGRLVLLRIRHKTSGEGSDGQSIEQQALNATIAKKKLQEQEKNIRELIVWAYGVETYQEMIMLRRKIKAQREEAIYKQRKRKRMILDSVIIMFAVGLGATLILGVLRLVGAM